MTDYDLPDPPAIMPIFLPRTRLTAPFFFTSYFPHPKYLILPLTSYGVLFNKLRSYLFENVSLILFYKMSV